METKLGKIKSVKFGYVGYDDMNFGLELSLDCGSVGVTTHIAYGWSIDIEVNDRTQWTEKDRDKEYAKTMRKINEVMKAAKVTNVMDLKGAPVEISFEGSILKDWRILTEVL